MKNFNNSRLAVFAFIFVLIFGFSAAAQRKRTSTKKAKPTAVKTTPVAATNLLSVKQGQQKVSDQIKTLGRFIYVLGNSAPLIKSVEEEARQGKLSAEAKQKGEAGKQGLIITISTFKNALLKLEEDFRANSSLRPYAIQLTGVGELAETAESQARANNFEQAARTLLEVLNQLTDTLQAMP